MAGTAGLAERLTQPQKGRSGDKLVTFTKQHLLAGLAMAVAASAIPQSALANSAAMEYFTKRADRSAVPTLLSADERTYYRAIFEAIDSSDWAKVQTMLTERADGPLHQVAKAEYYLAAGSPKIELDALNAWLAGGVNLPQSEQILSLARKRGATALPALPPANRLVSLPTFAKRIRPRETADGTMPAAVAASINDKIKLDDPAGAKILLDGIDALLSPAARAEWRSKVAWSFYIENDDASALAVAQTVQDGMGPWVSEGWWIAGLSAWRLGDCAAAADAFARTAQLSTNAELTAAAHYWNSRALVRCRQPEKATAPLRLAARMDETLYGMLAAEQLGISLPRTHEAPDATQSDWQQLREVGNIRIAVMLAEIGEDGLADEVLRHQARIGPPSQYQPLSRLARSLGLPGTQMWMAYNAPPGGNPEPAARFPTPKWSPVSGWKVDPALIYAHTLQESIFRTKVVSPAGARGLMQIMPSAARDHSRALGVPGTAADLGKPEVNLAFGQRHLEMLRDSPGTQGLLPKVMAAYNAGLTPISRWQFEVKDQGDPLLWIESVPYWETRGYVNIVMRNYWMYERQAGGPSESRMALAQGMWPTFPGLSGSRAVRLGKDGTVLRGR